MLPLLLNNLKLKTHQLLFLLLETLLAFLAFLLDFRKFLLHVSVLQILQVAKLLSLEPDIELSSVLVS